jgi:anti-anti-sigma factor
MKFRVREIDDIVEVALEGNMSQENVTIFRNRLNDLIESGKNKIILNLVATNYISSVCLAAIVDAKKRLVENGGDIKITYVNRLIRNLLEITNLTKKIEIYDTVEDAAGEF